MKIARWLILALLSLVLARPCAAGAGAEPFDFLFLDANARPVALGGAYTAMAADSNALLYNPAGLSRLRMNEATFMHNQYMQGVTQEYAGFASPMGWGLNLNVLSFGDVQKTTLSNPEGNGLGQTTLTDLALGAGYGRALTKSLALGVGLKYIRESIDNTPGSAFAVDIGGLYAVREIPGLNVGLALQNLGPAVRFESAKENLPLNLRAGAAYGFRVLGHRNTLSVDMMKERSQGALFAVGEEARIWGPLAVRLGFNTRNDAGLGITGGFGYLFRGGSIDYAFVPMGEVGDAHRISATLRWGPGLFGRAKPAEAAVAPSTTTPSAAEQAKSTETAVALSSAAAACAAAQPQLGETSVVPSTAAPTSACAQLKGGEAQVAPSTAAVSAAEQPKSTETAVAEVAPSTAPAGAEEAKPSEAAVSTPAAVAPGLEMLKGVGVAVLPSAASAPAAAPAPLPQNEAPAAEQAKPADISLTSTVGGELSASGQLHPLPQLTPALKRAAPQILLSPQAVPEMQLAAAPAAGVAPAAAATAIAAPMFTAPALSALSQAPAPALVCPSTEPVAAPPQPKKIQLMRVPLRISFNPYQTKILLADHGEVKKAADILREKPRTDALIEGYADSSGPEPVNLALSQTRAETVRSVLIEKFGIAADRVEARGLGSARPSASNATAEERGKNRRVEIVIQTGEDAPAPEP